MKNETPCPQFGCRGTLAKCIIREKETNKKIEVLGCDECEHRELINEDFDLSCRGCSDKNELHEQHCGKAN